MQIEQPRRRRRLVSLTPLIDVVFILLVFFMLASTFLDWRVFSVTVPADDTVADEDLPDPVVLRVERDRWLLDGEPVTRDGLRARLERMGDGTPQRVLVVSVDDDAPVQRMVDALDAAERAGVTEVSIRRETAP